MRWKALFHHFAASLVCTPILFGGPALADDLTGTTSSYLPLIRFPDVKPGGEHQVTLGMERPLRIVYAAEVQPESFRATLNGRNVTRLFNPAGQANGEALRLPLVAGENNLRIEVTSRRTASDPAAVLLPEEHILKIRLESIRPKVLTETRTFRSLEEAQAYIEAQGKKAASLRSDDQAAK